MTGERNADEATVAGFGNEWRTFDQAALGREEGDELLAEYFTIFPWESISPDATGFDMGCGSGRWASRVAPRVGRLHGVDAAADALAVARRNLADTPNVTFHHASVEATALPEGSMDFGYSLGVLPHVPDTGRNRSVHEAAQAGGSVPRLPVLRIRQPPLLVPRSVEGERCGAPSALTQPPSGQARRERRHRAP